MAATQANVHPLGAGKSIVCHSWNADGTKVALCPNNNEVHIYAKDGAGWKLEHVLTQHDSLVTGIDWAHKSNKIVSCSQDRNAYVWQFEPETGTWKPDLVILRVNRAATDVRWSPKEDKFAVASSAKVVSVCHFEEENEWWVSKHIKKHRSTVTKIAWHPNNVLLATASTDYKARVFSALIKGVDKPVPTTPFGAMKPFGEVLQEFDCNSWVSCVAFSPSGNSLAFTGHDSTLTVVDAAAGMATTTLRLSGLPFMTALFTEEASLIAAGHDCAPMLFKKAGGAWAFVKNVDEKTTTAAAAGASRAKFEMFQKITDLGSTDVQTVLETKHQNTITAIRPYKRAGDKVVEYTTTGLDGNLVFWKF